MAGTSSTLDGVACSSLLSARSCLDSSRSLRFSGGLSNSSCSVITSCGCSGAYSLCWRLSYAETSEGLTTGTSSKLADWSSYPASAPKKFSSKARCPLSWIVCARRSLRKIASSGMRWLFLLSSESIISSRTALCSCWAQRRRNMVPNLLLKI